MIQKRKEELRKYMTEEFESKMNEGMGRETDMQPRLYSKEKTKFYFVYSICQRGKLNKIVYNFCENFQILVTIF
jgi:hypothetical protein